MTSERRNAGFSSTAGGRVGIVMSAVMLKVAPHQLPSNTPGGSRWRRITRRPTHGGCGESVAEPAGHR
jgi:hypothetical protein